MTTTAVKRESAIYWSATAIVCAVMMFSAINFNLKNPLGPMKGAFAHLGFPDYFRIELTIAKALGVSAGAGGPSSGRGAERGRAGRVAHGGAECAAACGSVRSQRLRAGRGLSAGRQGRRERVGARPRRRGGACCLDQPAETAGS